MNENKKDQELLDLIFRIRKRARFSRVFAQFSVFIIIFVVALMIVFFTSTKPYFSASFSDLKIAKEPEEYFTKDKPPEIAEVTELKKQIESLRKQVQSQNVLQESILYSISASITRIASIFLAVYLMQILVGFTRYYFRMSDHLEATADSLELSKGNFELVGTILKSISPQHIEFGNMPKTPVEESAQLIRDLVNKLPQK